jgi:hypothetical protein
MFLTKQNSEDIQGALSSWDWLDFSGKKVIATTCFGDMFFESKEGIYFLDTISGNLTVIADSIDGVNKILNSDEGKNRYLMAGLVQDAYEKGLKLESGQCFDFIISPILGGKLEVENISVGSFQVSVNITGQIIKQVKDLPQGTKVGKIIIKDV